MENKILIVTDLDDTLLNQKSELSNELIEYIHELNNNKNIFFCIATGRSWDDSQKIYNELKLTTPIACSNGCYIHNPSDPNFRALLFTYSSSYLLNLFSNPMLLKNLDTIKIIYEENRIERIKKEFFHSYYIELENRKNDLQIQTIWLKTNSELLDPKFYKELKNVFHNLSVFTWDTSNEYKTIEVRINYINKEFFVNFLKHYYDVDNQNIYTFGDNFNDVEMLSKKYNSYAMKNSLTFVKNFAKNITNWSHDDDGVLKELKNILKYNK